MPSRKSRCLAALHCGSELHVAEIAIMRCMGGDNRLVGIDAEISIDDDAGARKYCQPIEIRNGLDVPFSCGTTCRDDA